MAQKDPRTVCAALAQPFAPEDLEWRLQKVNEERGFGIAVPYVTNRAIQTRLDDVVGPDSWYNEYKPWHGDGKKQGQICGISVYFEGRGWITKWDGAEDTDVEPVKGGLSDSMKRAAVQWGIGRVLYDMDTVFVDVEKKGRNWVIADSSRPKLNRAYLDLLDKLKLLPAPAGGIQCLLTSRDAGETSGTQDTPEAAGKPGAKEEDGAPEPKGPRKKDADDAQPPAPYEYIVRDARVQKGANGGNTQVILEDPDGKRRNAYVRGEHPELTKRTQLIETKLVQRRQDTVVYFVLERFKIAAGQEQAA